MKIISHVSEKKFLLSVSENEFKEITGITTYRISDTLKVDDCILAETELEISNGFKTAERINSIVQRKAFQDLKNNLNNAIKTIDDAEIKFCNLQKTIENK